MELNCAVAACVGVWLLVIGFVASPWVSRPVVRALFIAGRAFLAVAVALLLMSDTQWPG